MVSENQTVEDHLLIRAEQTLFLPADLGFNNYPDDSTLDDLISTFPGSEKSKTSTAIANRYWEEQGQATLYLMPTHEEIRNRLKFIAQDGKSENWTHYEGHKNTCAVSRWAEFGYSGGDCTCGRDDEAFDHARPTLAALDVALKDHTNRFSAHDNAPLFPLWIIDEIDFGRFVIQKQVRRTDIVKVASLYPAEYEPMRKLARAINVVIDRQTLDQYADSLNGPKLYEAIREAVGEEGTSLPALLDELRSLPKELPSSRWATNPGSQSGIPTLANQPRNFPRFLVPVLISELSNYLDGKSFNPRIHLVTDGRDPLQIRWRRQVIDGITLETEDGQLFEQRPHVMVLDASADIRLLNTIFKDVAQKYTPQLPEWPTNVLVHQWAGNTVSKTELGLNEYDAAATGNNSKLTKWLEHIEKSLTGIDRSLSVGVITHQAIEAELVAHVESLGFSNVGSMHFFNLRGSNTFERNRILIILGCPIPNLTGFQEECQAFFHDHSEILEFHPTLHKAEITMTDGRKYPVNEYGYGDDSVSAYYQQKSHAELYQALHRIRPYRPRQYVRHIFLFTNKPVEGVRVKEILVDDDSWERAIARVVLTRLEDAGEIRVRELVLDVSAPNVNPDSIARRIRRSGEAVAILTASTYERGKPGPGEDVPRFVKID